MSADNEYTVAFPGTEPTRDESAGPRPSETPDPAHRPEPSGQPGYDSDGDATAPSHVADSSSEMRGSVAGEPTPFLFRNFEDVAETESAVVIRLGCCNVDEHPIVLKPGQLVVLDRDVDHPVELWFRDRIVAHGRLVVAHGKIAVEVTSIVPEVETFRRTA